jgi:hypothetical protein
MINKENYEFLASSYFGSGERTILVCARRAYKDLQRNLGGIGEMPEGKKQDYKNEVYTFIADSVKNLLNMNVSSQEDFDKWHGDTCGGILEITKSRNIPLDSGFFYGHAQKWLNMTVKYMLVMELEGERVGKIKALLHVPVDGYILEGASDKGVPIPRKDGGEGEYAEWDSKPWSQWERPEYEKFQANLRSAVSPVFPMVWEFPTWIEVKRKREGAK